MDSEPVKNLFTGSFIYKDIGLCRRIVNVLLACCLTGISTMASAGVVIGGTRVVYSCDKSDATITVKNNEAAIPYLIQTWVDPFSNTGTAKTTVYRHSTGISSGGWAGKILRIMKTEGNLPQDRESVFWLNIKNIPRRAISRTRWKSPLRHVSS